MPAGEGGGGPRTVTPTTRTPPLSLRWRQEGGGAHHVRQILRHRARTPAPVGGVRNRCPPPRGGRWVTGEGKNLKSELNTAIGYFHSIGISDGAFAARGMWTVVVVARPLFTEFVSAEGPLPHRGMGGGGVA